MASDDFKRMIGADIVKYKDVVKAANLHFGVGSVVDGAALLKLS